MRWVRSIFVAHPSMVPSLRVMLAPLETSSWQQGRWPWAEQRWRGVRRSDGRDSSTAQPLLTWRKRRMDDTLMPCPFESEPRVG